jgi:hypothetical protein
MYGMAKMGTRSNDATEPTKGLKALKGHQNKGAEVYKTFPDNHVENILYNAIYCTNRRRRQNITKVIDIDITCIKF